MTMGLFSFLKGQNTLNQIDVGEDSDFVDLQFTITKYWQDEYGNHICEVKGLWKKDTIGFEIAFRPDMQLGIINGEVDKTKFYIEGINIYSIGEQSDKFVTALISLYKTDIKPNKMNDKITSTTFILGGELENFKTDYIKTKVFFDDTEEKGYYSEWYINIDFKNKLLELREKDPEYRMNIINMLTN